MGSVVASTVVMVWGWTQPARLPQTDRWIYSSAPGYTREVLVLPVRVWVEGAGSGTDADVRAALRKANAYLRLLYHPLGPPGKLAKSKLKLLEHEILIVVECSSSSE